MTTVSLARFVRLINRLARPAATSFTAIMLSAAIIVAGCANRPSTAEPVQSTASDPAAAESLAVQAGQILEADPAKAEQILREALALDPACGIAYNNLGVLAMRTSPSRTEPDLFTAAENFQAAARLMPGRPDPRVNLGLVMERAGRLDDALAAYSAAVDASPSHLPSIQALTSLEYRLDRTNARTNERLKSISIHGTDPLWRCWAKDKLLRQGRAEPK